MTKTLIAVLVALAVAGAGWYWYMGKEDKMAGSELFGTYAYTCSNGVGFEMTLFSDKPSVKLNAQGAAPFSEVTLEQKSGSTYATGEGEVVLVGEGEKITLTVGATTMVCDPVPRDDMAPFNWGNENEGEAGIN